TLLLMLPALLLGVAAGIALGTWQGTRAGRASDRAASALTLSVISFPEFLLGLVLSTVFALRLGWFPATGMRDARAAAGSWIAALPDVAWHAILPGATLVIVIAAAVARYQRAAVADAMAEEFVRAARARGASTRDIVFRHVLRRTAPTILTVIGLLLPLLVSGAALVEVVFNWPGAGATLLGAVNGRDYPLVIGLVVVGSVAVSAGTTLADLGAIAANPAQRSHA
ncbi:MAG: ABC transporter permease, partial [Gemmatimonadota bacterium]|nr:ABC transporter permease [Gemmatimonadota bacterium]